MSKYFMLFLSTCLSCVTFDLCVSLAHAADRDNTREQRMETWRAGRFGMFVHWGPYAVAAGEYQGKAVPHIGEWILRNAKIPLAEYEKMALEWKAEKYDPAQWVDFAQRCGVRYMVVTAKHHDGFALFDSKVSPWNAVKASGAKRDLLRPLADACAEKRMPLGFHYSQAQDWYHAGGGMYGKRWDARQEGDFDAFLRDVSLPQFRELVQGYGPVHSIFADTPVNMTDQRSRQFYEMLPAGTVVNDRMGGGAADYGCQEEFYTEERKRAGDWEFCTTMNGTWGYKKEPTPWKEKELLLRYLISTVAKGGNFLLNVGPLADGTFPPQAVERLEYIGQWLSRHGEAIYGAGACELIVPGWDGVCTLRVDEAGDSHVYLHFFQNPENPVIRLPRMVEDWQSAQVMGVDGKLVLVKTPKAWELTLPAGAVKPFTVVHLKTKGALKLDRPAAGWDEAGKMSLVVATAQLHGATITRERDARSPAMNIGYWTEAADSVSWSLELAEAAKVATQWRMACDPKSAGSEVALCVGEKELVRWTVPATKAWTDYQLMPGPEVSLPAGKYELILKVVSKPGLGVMNLREVVMEKRLRQ